MDRSRLIPCVGSGFPFYFLHPSLALALCRLSLLNPHAYRPITDRIHVVRQALEGNTPRVANGV